MIRRVRQNRGGDKSRNKILTAIREFHELNGYPPSIYDISRNTGLSKSNVLHHIRAMREKGIVQYKDGKARTIIVLKP